MSSEIQFFFLVDLLFTADEVHFPVRDGLIAMPPLPKHEKETKRGETDIRAREEKRGRLCQVFNFWLRS